MMHVDIFWQVACPRWEQLFRETFGPVTQLHIEAQALAGGWKQLYASKVAKKQLCPSEWEVKAFLEGLAACGAKDGIAVCALLDGSGSMGKGDSVTALRLLSHQAHLSGPYIVALSLQLRLLQFCDSFILLRLLSIICLCCFVEFKTL
jgi:hypothetical protein